MTPPSDDAADRTPAADEAEAPAGLLELSAAIRDDLRALLEGRLRLLRLEAALGLRNLIATAVAALLAGILLGGTWLSLVAAAVMWSIERGTSPKVALLLAAGCHLVGALGCLAIARSRARQAMFRHSFKRRKAPS